MANNKWISLLDYSDEASKRSIKFKLPSHQHAVLNEDLTPANPAYAQLEQYGAIRSCRFDRKERDQFLRCYIEFEDPQVVADLLARGYICINDNKIKIKPMLRHESKDSSEKTSKRLKLVDESLSVNILDALDDDCLQEIFRKLHLSTLHTVSNVCVRFNRIAKEIFKLKYQNETIQFCDVVMEYPISLQNAENFLKTFGPSIEKLTIDGCKLHLNGNDLLRLISKYCINIYDLKLHKFSVSNEILFELRQFFCRLKHRKFKVQHTQTLNDLLSTCSQRKLESVTIRNVVADECSLTQIDLPKLLELDLYLDYHTTKYVKKFKHNLQLKTINIKSEWHQHCDNTTTLFQDISENFPNIETMSIELYDSHYSNLSTDIVHFDKLKRLQRLKLKFNFRRYVDVTPLMKKMLENNVELKYLEVGSSIGDDGIDSISQMKSIDELHYGTGHWFPHDTYGSNVIQLKKLLSGLPRLDVISFCKSQDDSKNIIETIEQVIPFGEQLSILNMRVNSMEIELIPDFNEKICSELTAVIQRREKQKKLTIRISSLVESPKSFFTQAKCVTVINNEWLRVNLELSVVDNNI